MSDPAFDAAARGWRMPAEFEPHAATWMAWPCRPEIWGEHLAAVKRDYARLARAIAVGGGGFHCITQQQPRAAA